MAEDRFESRSEPPSSKRLAEARARGEVPRSAELSLLAMLLAATGMLGFAGGRFFDSLAALLAQSLQGAATFSLAHAFELGRSAALPLLQLLAAIFLAALVAPLLLSGWVFAPRTLAADPGRLNPFASAARLFSLNGVYGGLKMLLGLILAGGLLAYYLHAHTAQLFGIWRLDVPASLPALASWLGGGLLRLAGVVAVLALIDGLWQWWRHLSALAMTRSEMLAEAQEEEMSAAVRARMAQARESVRATE